MNTLLDSRTPEERRDDSKITSVTTSSADTLTEQEMVNKDGYYPYEVRILNNLLKRTSLSSNTKAEIIFALREEMKPLISTIKAKAVGEERDRIKSEILPKMISPGVTNGKTSFTADDVFSALSRKEELKITTSLSQ